MVQRLPASEIEGRVGQLPELPAAAGLVLTLLDDPDTTVTTLEEVIAGDAQLEQRFLHIANSSQFGAMRECETVGEAIVRLGFTAIRSWLLATATRRLFLLENASAPQRAMWQQTVVAALAAQRLAERTNASDPETAFLGGLLQNVGLLLIARNHPDVFEEIVARANEENLPIHEVERVRLGFDHADLSAILMRRWGLPAELVAAVGVHHRLEEAGPEKRLGALIALAEGLAQRAAAKEPPGELLEAPEVDLLGLDASDITSLSRRLEPMMLDRNLMS